MEDETIEDVKAAYGLLFRDMAALRVKADALCETLVDVMFRHVPFSNKADYAERARTAIDNYTGA